MARRGVSAALVLVLFFATIITGECSNNPHLELESFFLDLNLYPSGAVMINTTKARCSDVSPTQTVPAITPPKGAVLVLAAALLSHTPTHAPFIHQQGCTELTLPPHKRG